MTEQENGKYPLSIELNKAAIGDVEYYALQMKISAEALEKVSKLITLLPDFSTEPAHCRSSQHFFVIEFPYDPKFIKDNHQKMTGAGWVETHNANDANYYAPFIRYRHEDLEKVSVALEYRYDLDEATCTRTQIGSEKIEKSIYEITCLEGGEEKTFEVTEEKPIEEQL